MTARLHSNRKFVETPAQRLRVAYFTLHRVANAILEQHGVTADQFVLLRTLAEEEGVIQKELASRLSLDQNTVASMIRLLENQKIIQRRIVEHDARARAVYLTVRGRKVLEALIAKLEGFHRALDQLLPPDQMDVLLRGLALISEAMMPLSTQTAPLT